MRFPRFLGPGLFMAGVCAAFVLGAPRSGLGSPLGSSLEPRGRVDVRADEELDKLRTRANDAERYGALDEAAELWIEVSKRQSAGEARNRSVGRATDLRARMTLREELIEGFASNPRSFRKLGWTAVDQDGVEQRGERVEWMDLSGSVLDRAVRAGRLSPRAKLGLCLERMNQGEAEVAAGERGLHELLESGHVARFEVDGIVARARGVLAPEGGYRFIEGRWVGEGRSIGTDGGEEVDAGPSAPAGGAAALLARFAEAKAKERGTLWASLRESATAEELEAGLRARLEVAAHGLKRGRVLDQIERIVEQRGELDAKRADAIALIYDEVEYFYPYRPPQCPPEKAKLYPAVQRRVDVLVGEVRTVWEAPKRTKYSSSFKAGLEELAWVREQAASAQVVALATESLPGQLPEGLAPWVLGLDPRASEVSLHTFARDAEERAFLDRSAAIRARNQDLWKAIEKDRAAAEGSVPRELERRQVEFTNDYRVMFGHRALAWNPAIQVAARGHADWMSKVGRLTHENDQDPERQWPGDRMRLAGYPAGIGENCSRGRDDPKSAHEGWCHSSGHHRNLLNPNHREMASASSGGFWAQNFGVGQDFLTDLQEVLER